MPTPTKKTNKSVTFSPETADQTLLEAIEQALSEEQYSSFSDLCKQALQQTLLEAEASQPHANPFDLGTLLAPIQQQIHQLEAQLLANQSQQFEQLQTQVSQVAQQLEELSARSDRGLEDLQAQISTLQSAGKSSPTHQTTEYLNHLTSQLVHLTTQVETIESKITQQFADLQSQLEQSQIALPVSASTTLAETRPLVEEAIATEPSDYEPVPIFQEPSPRAPVVASAQESDPILKRLSSLLEDF
ncbi:MAG TPA: hypothetical protein V6C63_13065 [Allocoleopsis sp.]